MKTIFSRIKYDLIGYISLLLIGWFIIGSGMFSLFIFLLFIYLATDIVTKDLRKYIPFIPSIVLLGIFYIILISAFLFFILKLIPIFLSDATHYFDLIWKDIQFYIFKLSTQFNIPLDITVLTDNALSEGTKSVGKVIHLVNNISKMLVYFIFALVLNFLICTEKTVIKNVFTHKPDSILAYQYKFLYSRFNKFYKYFKQVMGGQVIISFINLLITMAVVSLINLPHKLTLYSIVFICGLLPVIGNLISNTILTITALFSVGFFGALICLGLLIGIHKLEYFLNSKIIGSIIRLPMFLTLFSLLIGEALLGIWGMIIAIPLFLTIKDELESTELKF